MVYFVGAGPGAVDLMTLRGKALLEQADLIIYAGSLVNPALLDFAKPGSRQKNSATMTLEEVLAEIYAAENAGLLTVRLHTGDPSLYGAIREQMDALCASNIPFEVVPGVSSLGAAAAALGAEYTLPGISQTLIISRMEGRTPVPEKEDMAALAAHGSSMAIFLSAGLLPDLEKKLLASGRPADTPAAIIYKASWPEQACFDCTISTLAQTAKAHGIDKTALILVGEFLSATAYERSYLYHPDFETQFRAAAQGTPDHDKEQ